MSGNLFGMSFGNGDAEIGTTKLPRETLVLAIRKLHLAHANAVDLIVGNLSSPEEQKLAVGVAEGTNDMLTDLGCILATFEEHTALSLTMSLSHTLFRWSEEAKKEDHAHAEDPDGGEMMRGMCGSIHKGKADSYREWAYRLLHEWADELMRGEGEAA